MNPPQQAHTPWWARAAHAQNGQPESGTGSGIQIEPFFQEATVSAEDPEATLNLEVTNNTDKTHTIRFSVVDFGQLSETGGVAFVGQQASQLQRKYGLAAWLSLPKETMILEPGRTQTLSATIINKESLSPGGHYAGIVGRFSETPATDEEMNTVSVQPAFVSLVFAKKTGGERYSLELDSIQHNGTLTQHPTQIDLRFHNTGNVHVVPRGVIQLTANDGTPISKGIINRSSLRILPESFRIYEVDLRSLTPSVKPGVYQIDIQYRYDGREEFSNHPEPYIFIGWYPFAITALLILVILSLWRRRH